MKLAEYEAAQEVLKAQVGTIKLHLRWRWVIQAAVWYALPFLGMWGAGAEPIAAARWAFVPALLVSSLLFLASMALLSIHAISYTVMPTAEPLPREPGGES